MAKQPRYDDEFRASAVLMLEAAGYPTEKGALARVARHLGINHQTLLRWARGQQNPPPPQLVQGLKRDIVDLLDDIIYGVAYEVKRRIDANELDEVGLPHLMTALGIGVDKKQLLTGKPTERVATVAEELAGIPEDERAAIIAEAEQILRENSQGGH
jgi:hypothetical protein